MYSFWAAELYSAVPSVLYSSFIRLDKMIVLWSQKSYCSDSFTAVLYNTVRCDTDSVEVVERGSELIHLFLADAFGVTGQNLVLDLINGASDGGEKLLPSNTNVLGTKTYVYRCAGVCLSWMSIWFGKVSWYLHGVVCVFVVENKCFLYKLVVSF